MLTLPDIKAKQILFIQSEHGAKIVFFSKMKTLFLKKTGKLSIRRRAIKILAVFIIGDFSFTSTLVRECRKRAVSLFFLNRNFGVYGYLSAKADGNYLLRSAQYSLSSNKELFVAKIW